MSVRYWPEVEGPMLMVIDRGKPGFLCLFSRCTTGVTDTRHSHFYTVVHCTSESGIHRKSIVKYGIIRIMMILNRIGKNALGVPCSNH